MEKKKIFLPKSVSLPCKLKWAVDNNSVVSFNQIIAFIIESKEEYFDLNNNCDNFSKNKNLLGDKSIHLKDEINVSSDINYNIKNENNLNNKNINLNGVLHNLNNIDTTTNNINIITNNIDTITNNIDTIANNIDIITNNIDTITNNIDTNTNNKETNINNKETNINNIDTITNNIDTNTNNKETITNNIDTITNNKETITNNIDTITNNKETNTNNKETNANNKETNANNAKSSEKCNVINFILNNRKNYEIKHNCITLRSNNHGRITIIKNNFLSEKEEYIYINNPDELLCEISDTKCNHEIIFSGLCTNCLLSQEEINKNKEEKKYFLSPGFLTNENELFINSDKALDLEKERIRNMIENKKLCLVLDLDNTLLHASFFLLSVNMNTEVVNITTDLDGTLENEMNFIEELNNQLYHVNNTKYEDKNFLLAKEYSNNENEVSFSRENEINNDNIALKDLNTNNDIHIKNNNDVNADNNTNYNKTDFLYEDINISKEINEDYLYSLFYKKKSSMEYNNKHQDIKSSYENYCDFLEKLNTLNLLKYNGKFIHYENLKDKNIKKKIEKLELSVLKTNVRYQKGSYTIYYKLRPGVIQFLQKMNEKFELYLFTMGTLEHAKSCLFLLDPLKKFFGNRIFSRKDSIDGLKHMNRILPTYRSISICIDDSDYVWKENSSCIKVHGYNFFPEINFLEDIKRKPYFLTKFFSLAQSYLNFSTTLYRFINLKCNEYEKMKDLSKDNILCNYINMNNSLSNFKSIGTNLKASLENEKDNTTKKNNGELNNYLYKNEGAITRKTNSINEIDENSIGEEKEKNNENEDFLILPNYDYINENDDESVESSENNFIDVDKEFETDDENDIELDSKVTNPNQLNMFDEIENLNKTYECANIKEEVDQQSNINDINSAVNVNEDEKDDSKKSYNYYENNNYDEKLDTINIIEKENSPSLLDNINDANNQKQDKTYYYSVLNYKTEEKKFKEFVFLNNITYQNDLPNKIENMLYRNIEEEKNGEEVPQNSCIGEKKCDLQNEKIFKKEEDLLSLEKEENTYYHEIENLMPLEENEIIKNNNLNLITTENNTCVDKQNTHNINNSSYVSLLKTHKNLDKNQNKKKKKMNKKNNIKNKNMVHGEETSRSFIPFSLLKGEKRYLYFEDEIIFKFISEKNYRKYDKYVLDFLNNYFEEEKLKKRNKELEKIDGTYINKMKLSKNYDMVINEKQNKIEKFHISNNAKKIKNKIKKGKVKRLMQYQNLSKNYIFNPRISKKKKKVIHNKVKLRNKKLNNHVKKTNKNEYYESFFIPKNLKEPKFKDNDKQLYYLTVMLEEIHHIFYKIFDHFKTCKINEENKDNKIYNYFLRYPIVRTILIEFRKQVLKDCIFNISLLSDDIKRSDFIDQIVKLGGIINNKNYTHILTMNNLAKKENLKDVKISNLMWIERALYTWKNADTKYYDANNWDKIYRNFWDVIEYEEKKKEKYS